MPSALSIRFALTTHDGQPRYREVSRLDPARVASGIARSPDVRLMGGYVFVHDGGVWNHDQAGLRGARPALYDPDDVRAGLDTLGGARSFLESAQLLFDQQEAVTAGLTEMTVVRIRRWQGHREVLLTGIDHDSRSIYPTIQVELTRLWDELLGASEAFVRFARELEPALEATVPDGRGAPARWRRDLARDVWESETEKLRARLI